MAEKYIHIWRTDQNTPQTRNQKDFMSSKNNPNWAIGAFFCPYTYGDDGSRHVSKKTLKINQFVMEPILESNISNV